MIIRIPLGTYALNRGLVIRLARLPTKQRQKELDELGKWLQLRAMTGDVKPGEIPDYVNIVVAFDTARLQELNTP